MGWGEAEGRGGGTRALPNLGKAGLGKLQILYSKSPNARLASFHPRLTPLAMSELELELDEMHAATAKKHRCSAVDAFATRSNHLQRFQNIERGDHQM